MTLRFISRLDAISITILAQTRPRTNTHLAATELRLLSTVGQVDSRGFAWRGFPWRGKADECEPTQVLNELIKWLAARWRKMLAGRCEATSTGNKFELC